MNCRVFKISNIHAQSRRSFSKIELIGNSPSNELQIPVPWGHMSVKQWGNGIGKPVIAIHSMEDNAGTFDTLAPLLPKSWNLVCIDLPGHGQSSHFETGHVYYFWDFLTAILRTSNFFKWKKFNCIGHGAGADAGLIFACLFPEKLNKLVQLDRINKYTLSSSDETLRKTFGQFYIEKLEVEAKDISLRSPSYSLDSALNEVIKRSKGALTLESAKILLKRGSRTLNDGKVQFTIDPNLLLPFPAMTILCTEQLKTMIKFMRSKHLIIKAKSGLVNEKPEIYEEFRELYSKYCRQFKYIEVNGTHYVHLNDPNKVSKHIINFLEADSALIKIIKKLYHLKK